MTCVHCDDLRRQLREANDELEAWRANDQEAGGDAWTDRAERYRTAIKGPALSSIAILMLLIDRHGRVASHADLLEATRCGSAFLASDQVSGNIVGVQLSRLRVGLRDAAAKGLLPAVFGEQAAGIQRHWGVGYSLPIENAAALRQLAGDA